MAGGSVEPIFAPEAAHPASRRAAGRKLRTAAPQGSFLRSGMVLASTGRSFRLAARHGIRCPFQGARSSQSAFGSCRLFSAAAPDYFKPDYLIRRGWCQQSRWQAHSSPAAWRRRSRACTHGPRRRFLVASNGSAREGVSRRHRSLDRPVEKPVQDSPSGDQPHAAGLAQADSPVDRFKCMKSYGLGEF